MGHSRIKETVKMQIPLMWGHMDALGHLNNAHYFRYFETVRMKYLESIGLPDFSKRTFIGPILKKANATFIRPIVYPDNLDLICCISEMTEDEAIMKHEIYSQQLGRVAAVGDGILVFYDYKENKKVSVPPELRASISEIENRSF